MITTAKATALQTVTRQITKVKAKDDVRQVSEMQILNFIMRTPASVEDIKAVPRSDSVSRSLQATSNGLESGVSTDLEEAGR